MCQRKPMGFIMSAIAGLIHLDASTVDRDTLQRMQTLLTPYGRDAQHSWHLQNVGLTRTLLRTTPEDSLDQQPLWRGTEKLALVFDGRIDNRDELCEKLGIGTEQAALMADSELVYQACLRWETATPKHLLGDFAIACWQPQRQRLWLARDPLGMRPFTGTSGMIKSHLLRCLKRFSRYQGSLKRPAKSNCMTMFV
ncbi:hypothetical protein HSBAA_63470 [Vreelandella sulfidaeris]|uniref:asparagine synthase (glutamine-hydrolyzing) n=1 Tax=Vreelandella sulfidaeris TaxID=115553 RepID=A0A455UK34_9GAMM|nr:hypothetical protein HSBAA_63470 [Halomonas sulfidaeris]